MKRIATVLLAALAVSTAHAAPAALPDYRPEVQVSGVIRSNGSDHMADLMKRWAAGFRRYQPNVWFETQLKGTATAQLGLHVSTADLALMGRQIFPYEYYGIFRRSQLYPPEIAVATGSFDTVGKSTAIGVFVHKDNPLRGGLTLAQLDGIWGDQRQGGWKVIGWDRTAKRGPEKNIRTWGQLGLTGAWADKPIHVYGPPGLYPGGVSYFQNRVMGGADTWNEALMEYDDRKAMLAALAADPYGIAYTAMAHATPQVRALPLAEKQGGPFVAPSRKTVADRSYPLSRFAYIYFAPDTPSGDPSPIDPKIREFLRYVLSKQGQEEVKREGQHLPLTAEVVAEMRKKLE